jgi:competence protein ComFB
MSEFQVKNVSEDLVDFYLQECMERAQVCTCERCIADVTAFALNQLPPRYVVTTVGSAFARARAMSTQSKADIIKAITSGINLVRNDPRHEKQVT